MEDGSGLRVARRWRLLLAHDATSSACAPLLDAIEGALGNVDVSESSSIDDARVALHTAPFDLVMVCLDLPPAPHGGVRLAQEVVRRRLPVILITRSLRWIPPGATSLHELPWITPDADLIEVARAVGEAVAAFGVAMGEAQGPSQPPLVAYSAG